MPDSSLPDTMTAWVIEDFGGPDVFHKTTRTTPTPSPGEVLVEVVATSVNPIDYKLRNGTAEALAPPRPAILHGDVAGIVRVVGEGVDAFDVGDEVYGCAGGFPNCEHGALADYMPCDADLLAHAPESLPLREAAALPLVAITAWESIVDKATVRAGNRVLVHGATGGVGHIGVQLAKVRGADVSVTASSDAKLAHGRDLGADHGINYTEESVEDYVKRLTDGDGFDVVFDTVGGDNVDRSIEAAGLNAKMATIAAREPHNLLPAYLKGLSIHTVLMLIPMIHGVGRAHHGEILSEVATLVDVGELRPLIDEARYTFDTVGAAHAFAESGEQVGKIVVDHPDAIDGA